MCCRVFRKSMPAAAWLRIWRRNDLATALSGLVQQA
jgi:hypothetical protein